MEGGDERDLSEAARRKWSEVLVKTCSIAGSSTPFARNGDRFFDGAQNARVVATPSATTA